MNSEQIKLSVQKYLADGGKIKVLPADNKRFFFPPIEDQPEDLVDKFAYDVFEDDERFYDILD